MATLQCCSTSDVLLGLNFSLLNVEQNVRKSCVDV